NDTILGLGGNDTLIGGVGNDSLDGGAGDDSVIGGAGADTLVGADGNDTLDGWSPPAFASTEPTADTLDGGLGNDVFKIDNPNDVLIDAGGIDTVWTHNIAWTLAPGFENLVINNGETEITDRFTGNDLDNVMDASRGGWNYILDGGAGNDLLIGGGRSGTLLGGAGNDTLLAGSTSHATLDGGDGNDSLVANNLDWFLVGGAGDDTLVASGNQGVLTGGTGADQFVFSTFDAFNSPAIRDFETGIDKIHLDARAMSALGINGNFSSNDPRFYAAPGATGGHDADDRVVYDTTSGKLYYDADGTGPGAAQVVATIHNPGIAAALVATHLAVDNRTSGGGIPPPPPPRSIPCTADDD